MNEERYVIFMINIWAYPTKGLFAGASLPIVSLVWLRQAITFWSFSTVTLLTYAITYCYLENIRNNNNCRANSDQESNYNNKTTSTSNNR